MTALPCPTPTKSRYATTAAADQAARHVQIPVGTIMRAYECQCGWWHLTRSSTPAEPIPYEDLTPADGDEQVVVERARAAGRPRREQRRIAGDVAVKLLIAAHEDEFYGLFAAECERLGLPLTARDEARVQRGLGEAA